jgi:hypothetical protein
MESRKAILRVFASIFLLVGVLSLVKQIFLWSYYINHAPDSPKPSLGRTYPLVVHKNTVYLTRAENESVNGPWMLIAVSGVGIFLVLLRFSRS